MFRSASRSEPQEPSRVCEPPLFYNLQGLWVGRYGQHGEELIRIDEIPQENRTLLYRAVKLTGDSHVPTGETSFEVTLESHREDDRLVSVFRSARGQVAEDNFRNPQWVSGTLTMIDAVTFDFTWQGVGTGRFRSVHSSDSPSFTGIKG
eukprot:TRINITY_DN1966_c0_g1_i10.p1 TRINITY_DN1966_c0_g1~~TRINITY_DN1966_c0_g1_i10.p1  ORF type:complete len:149 (+),score=22.12 TRINITY_DN1966_c0_g1_i10:62-508(+)